MLIINLFDYTYYTRYVPRLLSMMWHSSQTHERARRFGAPPPRRKAAQDTRRARKWRRGKSYVNAGRQPLCKKTPARNEVRDRQQASANVPANRHFRKSGSEPYSPNRLMLAAFVIASHGSDSIHAVITSRSSV